MISRSSHERLVFRSCLALRLPGFVQRPFFRGELAILMYHGIVRQPLPVPDWCFVSETRFAGQMEYLRTHFDVLPLSEALLRLRAGGIKHPTAAITFDDGFRSVHDLALPILRRLGLPATVFLNTGLIDGNATTWFCRLLQALSLTPRHQFRWCATDFDLSQAVARAVASATLQAHLKQFPHDELMRELEAIVTELGVTQEQLSPPAAPYRILDGTSIREMLRSGLFELGAHTSNHAILTRVSPERARTEIEESVRMTEALTGEPCRLFAYPNGRAQDYDAWSMDTLRNLGVTAAVTAMEGSNTQRTPLLELRRYGIGPSAAMERFQTIASRLMARRHPPN